MIRLPEDLARALQEGATLVVPSRQRAHAVRLAYAARQLDTGARVWSSPDVLPFDAWLVREAELGARLQLPDYPRLLAPAEQWLLWREAAAQATRDLPLLHVEALAERLRSAWELAAELAIDTGQLPHGATPEIEVLRDSSRAVGERCRVLAALSAHAAPPPAPTRALLCAGFLMLPMQLSRARCITAAQDGAESRPRIALLPSAQHEAEEIALWCHARLSADPRARLLVIMAGDNGARERLATLIRQVLSPGEWLSPGAAGAQIAAVNIEGGRALAEHALVGHALTTLQLLAGMEMEFATVSEWLRSPWWSRPAEVARLELWLRESRTTQARADDWLQVLRAAPAQRLPAAAELDASATRALLALGSTTAAPRQWSERFRAALEALGSAPRSGRDSAEQQTLLRFHELLDEFGQLSQVLPRTDLRTAVRTLAQLARHTVFAPAEPDAAVTLSAAWGDPIVHYDGIWVAGLNADGFPQPIKPDPFLPLRAQLEAGYAAASAAGRLREAQQLLALWRRRTPDLVLSTPLRDGDLELMPSPLLAPWLESPTNTRRRTEDPAASQRLAAKQQPTLSQRAGGTYRPALRPPAGSAPAWLALRIQRQGLLETLTDLSGERWPVGDTLPGGTRSLELQNLCPFRAYGELRLGARELDEPEPGVRADVRGKLLHTALEILWQRLKSAQLLAAHPPARLQGLIESAVQGAALDVWGVEAALRPPWLREQRRAVRLIGRLCELERQRPGFTVEALERDVRAVFAGAGLNMRIDRIDRLESGGLAILDYKSGQPARCDWYGERPSHPQLLAYLAALHASGGARAVEALATVNITAREVRYTGVARTAGLLPKVDAVERGAEPGETGTTDIWQQRTTEWLQRIEQLTRDFLAGRAEVDPREGACDFCHLTALCRIADRGLVTVQEMIEHAALAQSD